MRHAVPAVSPRAGHPAATSPAAGSPGLAAPARRGLLRRAGLLALAAAGPATLAGCATPQATALRAAPPSGPARVELTDVPFHPQRDYECGPAALATVLAWAGRPVAVDELVRQVYLPTRLGSLQPEITAAIRRQGLVPCPLAPRLDALFAELADGRPVLLLQNLAFGFAPVWHYAVAVGFDRADETVLLRSGVTRRLVTDWTPFERTWMRADGWAVMACPPASPPATATPAGWLAAVAPLERNAPAAALAGYRSALTRWPDEPLALLGAGNAAWRLQDGDTAEAMLRRASERAPDLADAWNNLAVVLAARGRRDEGVAAARRAVALGGTRLPAYRQTLDELLTRP